MNRMLLAFLAGSLIPPLGAVQLLTAQGKLVDASAWLAVAGIAVSSTSASAIYTLTMLNREAGNPDPQPVIASPEHRIPGDRVA